MCLRRAGGGGCTSSALGSPVCGSTNAKVLTSNLLTWEWEVVRPCLSTGTELLMLSKGLGHLSMARNNQPKKISHLIVSTAHFKDCLLYSWSELLFFAKVQWSFPLRLINILPSFFFFFLTLPIVKKHPHRMSRFRVCKTVLYAQGQRGIRGRLGDGNLHVCGFMQGQGQWKLVLGVERCKGCV